MGWPIFWSVGLHALLLGALVTLPPRATVGVAPAQPLRAALLPAATRAEPVLPPPQAAPLQRQPAVRTATKPVPSSVEPVRAVSPALTFAPRRDEEPVTTVTEVGGMPIARATSAPANVALTVPVSQQGPDAAGLRQYRLALAGEARRHRHYPDAARREGIAGTAEVRVSVNGSALRQAELARSSGHAALDTAALEMLRAAAMRAHVPDSLRGQAFAVLLPVVFEVDE